MSIKRPQIVWYPSKEYFIKTCDYERDYVCELQKILFSYFKNDIWIISEALKKIKDKDWKLFEQFEKEIRCLNLSWMKDYFMWWDSLWYRNIEKVMKAVMLFHEKLENIKKEINKQIKNPEEKLQTVDPFVLWIHWRWSPRSEKYIWPELTFTWWKKSKWKT